MHVIILPFRNASLIQRLPPGDEAQDKPVMRVAAKRRGFERILPCISLRENPISVGFPSFAPYGAKFTLSCVFYTVKEKILFQKTIVKSIINTY